MGLASIGADLVNHAFRRAPVATTEIAQKITTAANKLPQSILNRDAYLPSSKGLYQEAKKLMGANFNTQIYHRSGRVSGIYGEGKALGNASLEAVLKSYKPISSAELDAAISKGNVGKRFKVESNISIDILAQEANPNFGLFTISADGLPLTTVTKLSARDMMDMSGNVSTYATLVRSSGPNPFRIDAVERSSGTVSFFKQEQLPPAPDSAISQTYSQRIRAALSGDMGEITKILRFEDPRY